MNFTLSPEQAHYVTKVMRIGTKKSRDSVRVFDGVHGEWLAKIIYSTEMMIREHDGDVMRRASIITAHCTLELRPQPQSAEHNRGYSLHPLKSNE